MIAKRINELLKTREFISVATCDLSGRPNAAPKFILKQENHFIYLIDYTIGRTWENLLLNPRVSLSFMDTDTLHGYQVNGSAELIDKGKEYDLILEELVQKEIDFSTKRIIEGVTKGKSHQTFELGISDRFVVFKIKIEEAVELSPTGELKREKVC